MTGPVNVLRLVQQGHKPRWACWIPQPNWLPQKGSTMLNRKSRVVAAVTSALAGAAIGGGIAVANATPAPPPPAPPTVGDTPEPGDSPDFRGAADTDTLQEGDQNGPEVPDPPAPPAPPPR